MTSIATSTKSKQAAYSQTLLSPQPAAALAQMLANLGWVIFQVTEPDDVVDGCIELTSDTAPIRVAAQVLRPGFGAPVITTGNFNGPDDNLWSFNGKACLTLEVLLADIQAAIEQGADWRGARPA